MSKQEIFTMIPNGWIRIFHFIGPKTIRRYESVIKTVHVRILFEYRKAGQRKQRYGLWVLNTEPRAPS